jgi:hypothetical protein
MTMTNLYQTSDFLTAATLLVRKHSLLGIDTANPRRVVFQFQDHAQLHKDIELLNRGELLVDPTDFWAAERRCKQLIHEGERQ